MPGPQPRETPALSPRQVDRSPFEEGQQLARPARGLKDFTGGARGGPLDAVVKLGSNVVFHAGNVDLSDPGSEVDRWATFASQTARNPPNAPDA